MRTLLRRSAQAGFAPPSIPPGCWVAATILAAKSLEIQWFSTVCFCPFASVHASVSLNCSPPRELQLRLPLSMIAVASTPLVRTSLVRDLCQNPLRRANGPKTAARTTINRIRAASQATMIPSLCTAAIAVPPGISPLHRAREFSPAARLTSAGRRAGSRSATTASAGG